VATLVRRRRSRGDRYRAQVPEILEIEYYRALATAGLGREIEHVWVDELAARGLEPGVELEAIFPGLSFIAARRRGKLLLLDTEGPTLGMRFGMTGGLLLDGLAGVDRLRYGPGTYEDRWIRARILFADGGSMLLHDPRRLGRLSLDPDEDALGPDAFSLTLGQLRGALGSRAVEGPPLKARLLDQSKIAGIGNLLADEMLFRAKLDPRRPSTSLSEVELKRLHRQLRATLSELFARGGSHTGDHMEARVPQGRCPRDGAAMHRATIGGRTTYWCSEHQR
jgi:formamidopyrimidine-DNA glycosylase